MCAIFGAIGLNTPVPVELMDRLSKLATSRGRDGVKYSRYRVDGLEVYLGNARAAPTTELQFGRSQPYNGLVHNGTISNDVELGRQDGEIDSEVFSRVLERGSLDGLAESLKEVKGSYAFGLLGEKTLYLGRNFKPLYYVKHDGVVWFASMPYMLNSLLNLRVLGIAPVELDPYSVMDARDFSIRKVDQREWNSNRILVIASAGLDSTAVATHYASQGKEVTLLHFTYGCVAQSRELDAIHKIANELSRKFATSCKVRTMSLPYSEITSNSPILGEGRTIAGGVEGAEYAFEWVPARNLLMVAAGVALAEAEGYGIVSLGFNLEESGAYPDNEEAFTHALNTAMTYAVSTEKRVKVECPFDRYTKREIVQRGLEIGAPFELTWSCYRSGETHCGECGPCTMRRIAFQRNGTTDPVIHVK